MELQKAVEESGAEKIFAEADFSPYAKSRDIKVAKLLPCEYVSVLTIHPPVSVRKTDGTPYTVFTSYKKAWGSLPSTANPLRALIQFSTRLKLNSLKIPTCNRVANFPASESEAEKRFDQFFSNRSDVYDKDRDRMDLSRTSKLSPYLRFGLISARKLVFFANDFIFHSKNAEARTSAEIWLSEFIWRDFYYSILDNFPFVLKRAFRKSFTQLP